MMWRLKILVKVALSRLGLPYDSWRLLGLFRHGGMDKIDYAEKIFDLHIGRAYPDRRLDDKVVVEIGPGDSLASLLLAKAHGASSSIMIDAGAFATRDMVFYRTLSARLAARSLPSPDLSGAATLEDVVRACSGQYRTAGLRSFLTLPDQSVDFLWSHSVLEHIPLHELPTLMTQMHRVLKPGGRMSHNIDFQDHLAHSLNNLRFSEAVWESPLIQGAGFYTNRVRAKTLHKMACEAGFVLMEENFGCWPEMPIPRHQLDAAFRGLEDAELRIRTSHMLARRAA